MSHPDRSRLLRPQTLTAIGILVAAAAFVIPTLDLPPMAALLPAAMLVALMVLSVFLLLGDQRKAAAGTPAEPMTSSPRRVAGAFALIVLYAVSVDLIGFYPSTAISVPLVAWAFGFRNPAGLALATVIVLGAIYLIFSLSMSQEFPVGRLWSN